MLAWMHAFAQVSLHALSARLPALPELVRELLHGHDRDAVLLFPGSASPRPGSSRVRLMGDASTSETPCSKKEYILLGSYLMGSCPHAEMFFSCRCPAQEAFDIPTRSPQPCDLLRGLRQRSTALGRLAATLKADGLNSQRLQHCWEGGGAMVAGAIGLVDEVRIVHT